MPRHKFEKGKPKTGGRKPGSRNKRDLEVDTICRTAIELGMDRFLSEMKKLKGYRYVDAYLSIMEYVKPKQSRAVMVGDSDNPVETVTTIRLIRNTPQEPPTILELKSGE